MNVNENKLLWFLSFEFLGYATLGFGKKLMRNVTSHWQTVNFENVETL